MPRGRLIFRMTAAVKRLDTATMGTSSVYDDDFREPLKTDSDNDGLGEEVRKELDTDTIPVQVEDDRDELQRMTKSGNVPDSAIGLVVHMRQMENDGLVAANGSLESFLNARLLTVKDRHGNTTDDFTRVPVYCTHAKRLRADISRRSNLALLIFGERPQGRP